MTSQKRWEWASQTQSCKNSTFLPKTTQHLSLQAPQTGLCGRRFWGALQKCQKSLQACKESRKIFAAYKKAPDKLFHNLSRALGGDPGAIRTRGLSLRRSFLPCSRLFPVDLPNAKKPVKLSFSNKSLCSRFLRWSSWFPACISRLLATANIGGWPFLQPPPLLAEIGTYCHHKICG